MYPGIAVITFHIGVTFLSTEFTTCTLPIRFRIAEAAFNSPSSFARLTGTLTIPGRFSVLPIACNTFMGWPAPRPRIVRILAEELDAPALHCACVARRAKRVGRIACSNCDGSAFGGGGKEKYGRCVGV